MATTPETDKRCGTCRFWGSEHYSPKATTRACEWMLTPEILKMLPAAAQYLKTCAKNRNEGVNCVCWQPLAQTNGAT